MERIRRTSWSTWRCWCIANSIVKLFSIREKDRSLLREWIRSIEEVQQDKEEIEREREGMIILSSTRNRPSQWTENARCTNEKLAKYDQSTARDQKQARQREREREMKSVSIFSFVSRGNWYIALSINTTTPVESGELTVKYYLFLCRSILDVGQSREKHVSREQVTTARSTGGERKIVMCQHVFGDTLKCRQ